MKKNVLILYNHISRELDVACAYKYISEIFFGINVIIKQYQDLNSLTEEKFDVVLIPHAYTNNHVSFIREKFGDVIIINLTWEQLIYDANKKAKSPTEKLPKTQILHYVWGNFYSDFLQSLGVPLKNIYIGGNPAYALYCEPYSRYFVSKKEIAKKKSLDLEKKWILFPENYNWGFFSEEALNEFVTLYQLDKNEVLFLRDFCQRSMAEVVKWFDKYLAVNQVEIIIRPRPLNSEEQISNFIKNVLGSVPQGMHICKEGTVREWILSSDVVVSSYSTTLIESSIAKKPCYILEPEIIPQNLHVEWHDYLPHICNYDEFSNILLNNNEKSVELLQWSLKNLLNNGDPIWNIAKMVNCVISSDNHSHYSSLETSFERKNAEKRKMNLLKSFLLENFQKKPLIENFKNYNQEKVKIDGVINCEVVGDDEITSRVERWKNILTEYQPCQDKGFFTIK